MSLIVVRPSGDCAFNTVDTTADIREFIDSLRRTERHWSGCVTRWHVSDDAVTDLTVWAAGHGHTVTAEDVW